MKIGITKCESKFEPYLNWLNHFGIEYLVLDYEINNFSDVNDCSGLILSGGKDIYPELYCDWEDAKDKGTYNTVRDGFEFRVLEDALNSGMPVLGICRGMQLINVYFKGNLIYDLPSIRNVKHRSDDGVVTMTHGVKIIGGSLLSEIAGVQESEVTSSHHQSVDRPGEGLMVNAKSPDGIVEGIEYAEKTGKGFLLGVQWHPERFEDIELPLSKNILLAFIESAKSYK